MSQSLGASNSPRNTPANDHHTNDAANSQSSSQTATSSQTAPHAHIDGHVLSVEEVAARLKLKPQKNGKWHGAPEGTGATKDGFVLCPEGNAFTNGGDKYNKVQVAELAGILPEEYAPVAEYQARKNFGAPRKPSSTPHITITSNQLPTPPKTPQERGITQETLRCFQVVTIHGAAPNSEGWKYLTHHANGQRGRDRFKNARTKSDTEAKYCWRKGGDNAQPDAYNIHNIPDDASEVWVVGGEPDVWAMAQNGFDAVATFGETQGAAKLVAAIKAKRVQVLNIALDNDKGGDEGARNLARECQNQGQNFTVRRFEGAHGFDVCDQFEACIFDREKFRMAIMGLPEIPAPLPDSTLEPPLAANPSNPFQLIPLKDIFARPRAKWLVRGLLLENGYSAITGNYGTFKSFVALDMALCVAAGRTWQGREVKQGTVVYVVAEGAYTTADRVKAWCIRHQSEVPENFYLIETPAQIAAPIACAQFIERIKSVSPAFVVFDTLAKCNVGADENSSRDMGLFTHGMQTVATATNAQVLAIHHNNKNGSTRGSNSLPCNVDTHITMKASAGHTVTLSCEKQKGAPFEEFSLVGRIVELGETDEYGEEITSLVFEPTNKVPIKESDGSEATCEKVLQVLAEMPDGASATQWQSECKRLGIVKDSRFYDYRDELVKDGQVTLSKRVYRVSTPITPTTL